MPLSPGTERSEQFRVEGALLTDVDGTLPTPVLSTPGMILMMEHAAARHVQADLPAGHATVGFEVCVKHVGGALEGATCTVSARLREVVDERKLRFDVEVREGERTIGVGTHERRVVDVGAQGPPGRTSPDS
jgi:predicted thioesterase